MLNQRNENMSDLLLMQNDKTSLQLFCIQWRGGVAELKIHIVNADCKSSLYMICI